jgi:hypothetical protein
VTHQARTKVTMSIPELLPPRTCDSPSEDKSEYEHWMTNDDTALLPVNLSQNLLSTRDPHRNKDKHTHQLDPLIIRKMHPA